MANTFSQTLRGTAAHTHPPHGHATPWPNARKLQEIRGEMKKTNLIFSFVVLLVLAGGLGADWTPFMPVWDTNNWGYRFYGEGVYTDSLGNCIILSAGINGSDTLFIDAFVYNHEFGCFDTFEAILKHSPLTDWYWPTIFCPYYFHNLITDDGIVMLPVVIPPNHVYYITFDGVTFTPHYLPLTTGPGTDCQLSIFAQMRERGILSLAVAPVPPAFAGCCSTYVFPDVTDPDSIIAIWTGDTTLYWPYSIDHYVWLNNKIYIIYTCYYMPCVRLSRFDGDSETVMWEMGHTPRFLSKEDLTSYRFHSDGFMKIDSTGAIDTIFADADLGGIYNNRAIISRDGNKPLGWMHYYTDDSLYVFVWISDSGVTVDTTNLDGTVLIPFYGVAETTPGTIYGVSTSSVFPSGVLGFFAYHDTIVSGISEENIKIPDNPSIFISPNPFNSVCKLTTPGGAITTSVYDIIGREIYTINVNKGGFFWEGVDQRGDKLNAGLYFIVVYNRAGEILAVQKAILIK